MVADGREPIFDRRIKGQVTEWHGSYGWVSALEDIGPYYNGRLYLHRKDLRPGTEPELGRELDFMLYRDPKGLGCADAAAFDAEAEEAGAAVKEEESLPQGWKRVWSEEHREWYFWNNANKESRWTRPSEPPEEALPEGWQKVLDVETGQHYYWHQPTRVSSWEPPEAPSEAKELPKQPLDLTKRHRGKATSDAGERSAKHARVANPVAQLVKQWGQQDAAESDMPETAPEAEEDPEAPLPPGWEQHWSEEHGSFYYWHRPTKQSSWERPTLRKQQAKPKPAAPGPSEQSTSANVPRHDAMCRRIVPAQQLSGGGQPSRGQQQMRIALQHRSPGLRRGHGEGAAKKNRACHFPKEKGEARRTSRV
ncbi:unnamed protein product [Effrenium voratum]|nr:unnamed protein product [Effrenium voratum]